MAKGIPGSRSVCSITSCERPAHAKTWCLKHYRRYLKHGAPDAPLLRVPCPEVCAVADCGRKPIGKGFCVKHYQRNAKYGDPTTKIGKGYREDRISRREAEGLRRLGQWRCGGCKRTLPKDEFYLRPDTGRVHTACKLCCRLARHNVTYSWYTAILLAQNGMCAVSGCLGEPAVIDHDHACCPGENSCGQCVRALLCIYCNTGIGYFKDEPERLEQAAAYLRDAAKRHLGVA